MRWDRGGPGALRVKVCCALAACKGTLDSGGEYDAGIPGTDDAPHISNQAFAVQENAGGGTVVGTAVASDIDVGDALTFSITAGNTDGAVAINSETGAITVANSSALDYEASSSFTAAEASVPLS